MKLELYPNPVSSIINISNVNDALTILNVTIYSSDGAMLQELKGLTPNNGTITNAINVQSLPSGVYFIKFDSNNTDYSILKFIKN